MTIDETTVAAVDAGPFGTALCVGARRSGDVLAWYDLDRVRLARGRVAKDWPDGFEFERASDGLAIRFARLTLEAFERDWRARFPDAPYFATDEALARWLVAAHGLWRTEENPPQRHGDTENAPERGNERE